jgi:hypothetical protein
MRTALRLAAASLLLALPSGCLLGEPGDQIVYSPCHALAGANWRAWVERIDVSHQKAPLHRTYLFVQGDVTVPSDGWEASLARGPVQQLAAPVQQILVRTSGAGSGAPVVRRVSGRFRALPRYGAIAIRCGDGTLAIVRDVLRKD